MTARIVGDFSHGLHSNLRYSGKPNNFLNEMSFVLPHGASDHIYKDDIGYNYQKKMEHTEEGIKVTMQPRFPLGGGWKYEWFQSYSLNLNNYLMKNDVKYDLHVENLNLFADVFVEKIIFEFILPEGSDVTLVETFNEISNHELEYQRGFLEVKGRPSHKFFFNSLSSENKEIVGVNCIFN